MSGQWGLGVDQIIGAKVADANGEIVQASEEMLKGIRGASGNFGVVVELQIKIYELQSVSLRSDHMSLNTSDLLTSGINLQLLAGLLILDSSKKGVSRTFADFMTGFQSLQAPGQFPLPATAQPLIVNHPQMGQTILVTFVWSSPDHVQGKQVLERLLAVAPVAMQTVTETNVTDWLKLLESFCPYGVFGGDKGISFRQLNPNTLEIIGRHLERMPSDPAAALSVHMLSRFSPSATNPDLGMGSCFNPEAREEHVMLELIGSAVDQSRLPQSQKWIKDMYDELKESGEAMDETYVALASPEDMTLDKVYGTEWEGLLELKAKLDPDGVFKNAIPKILIA